MSERFDVAVVGAGILGLAHAWHLARRGRRVVVVERSAAPRGASLRNFGMVWPIGQPAGERRDLALRSRVLWCELIDEAGLWHDPVGSLHVATEDDELRVLEEFVAAEASHEGLRLLDPESARERCPRLRPDRVKGALFSPSEMKVDPREVLTKLPEHLAANHAVSLHFDTLALGFEAGRLRTSRGDLEAEQLIVCSGSEMQQLYPELLASLDLRRCQLQMMEASSSEDGPRWGPMLAGGLTLAHYPAFQDCPSLPALVDRFEREHPRARDLGIHVLLAQGPRGELIVGDSHDWGGAQASFLEREVEEIILDYLESFVDPGELVIERRWDGEYLSSASRPFLIEEPEPGVTLVTGLGGAGMTLSFGVAEGVVATRF